MDEAVRIGLCVDADADAEHVGAIAAQRTTCLVRLHAAVQLDCDRVFVARLRHSVGV
jgi:hypothetical protein